MSISANRLRRSMVFAPIAPRNAAVWPFAAVSIWNMPLGSSAVYVPLGMTVPEKGYGSDECYLVFDPNAPLRSLIDRGYWYPYPQTGFTATDTGVTVRVPDEWIVPVPVNEYNTPNRGSAALLASGLAQEFQYTVRENPATDISMFQGVRATYDLTGDGLTGPNGFGAHGGSGMTAIGGTIRSGELAVGAGQIRHALSVTMNTGKWATMQGGAIVDGFRWPAIAADSYWDRVPAGGNNVNDFGYGTWDGGIYSKDGLGMGSLLALPQNFDLVAQNFETNAGYKIAEALRNYGAYVVDSVYPTWDDLLINMEMACYTDAPEMSAGEDPTSPYRRDLDKVIPALCLIDNNTASSIGGGGTPLLPLAPDFA